MCVSRERESVCVCMRVHMRILETCKHAQTLEDQDPAHKVNIKLFKISHAGTSSRRGTRRKLPCLVFTPMLAFGRDPRWL